MSKPSWIPTANISIQRQATSASSDATESNMRRTRVARGSDHRHGLGVESGAGDARARPVSPWPPEAESAEDHGDAFRDVRPGGGDRGERKEAEDQRRGRERPGRVGGEVAGRDDEEKVQRVHEVEDARAEPLLEADRQRDPSTWKSPAAELAVFERDPFGGRGRGEEPEPVDDERELGRCDWRQVRIGSRETSQPDAGEHVRSCLERDRRCEPRGVGAPEARRSRPRAHRRPTRPATARRRPRRVPTRSAGSDDRDGCPEAPRPCGRACSTGVAFREVHRLTVAHGSTTSPSVGGINLVSRRAESVTHGADHRDPPAGHELALDPNDVISQHLPPTPGPAAARDGPARSGEISVAFPTISTLHPSDLRHRSRRPRTRRTLLAVRHRASSPRPSGTPRRVRRGRSSRGTPSGWHRA